ncbi:hypothetical protein O6H91_Y287600 [Diphasiastrum complanatum]|nr:hypothetical protein O6H91_Y287600 [Diphasiastrum complanatum]
MKCFPFPLWEKEGTSSKGEKSSCWPLFRKGSSEGEPTSGTSGTGGGSQTASTATTFNSHSHHENSLGEGGFGCVYKGLVAHRDPYKGDIQLDVAVKQLNSRGQQGHKEWLAEVKYLERVNHPNLVKLIGYCVEDDDRGQQMLLVYEFMPKISLEVHLFRKGLPVLSWQTRLNIALGVAEGLLYLHEGLDIQIILRDLKPSNILLDKDYTPKLSDFGLARQGPDAGHSHVSTAVVGTMGYAAPEYIQTGHLTAKNDVWSFGIVLLELLTGRRALDSNLPRNEQYLMDWCKPYIGDNRKLRKIMDQRLGGQYDVETAERIASLACQCTLKIAKSRPKMRAVVEALKEIVESPHL